MKRTSVVLVVLTVAFAFACLRVPEHRHIPSPSLHVRRDGGVDVYQSAYLGILNCDDGARIYAVVDNHPVGLWHFVSNQMQVLYFGNDSDSVLNAMHLSQRAFVCDARAEKIKDDAINARLKAVGSKERV